MLTLNMLENQNNYILMWPAYGSTDIPLFYCPDINLFLIDYAWCELYKYFVAPFQEQLQEKHYTWVTLKEKHCCSYYSR